MSFVYEMKHNGMTSFMDFMINYRISSIKGRVFLTQKLDQKLICVISMRPWKLSKVFSEYFQIQCTHDDLYNVRHFENETGSFIAGLIQAIMTFLENLQSSLALNSFMQQLY